MHLGRRVVDNDAARFLLLLFLRVIGRQVGRDTIPGLAVVGGPEKELRTQIKSAVLTNMDRSVPVEPQLPFAVAGQRLDAARLVRLAVYAADIAALRFGIQIIGI